MVTSWPAVYFTAAVQVKENLHSFFDAVLLFSQSCFLDLTWPISLINSRCHPAWDKFWIDLECLFSTDF